MLGRLDGAHHLRSAPRYKLFEPTEMHVGGAGSRVHLLNLSTGGALVYAATPPAPGTALQLRCGGRVRSARVAWATERRFGVAFASPLGEAEVSGILRAQDAHMASAGRRIGSVPA
jgi:hypothetical protein